MKGLIDIYLGHIAAEDKSPDTLAQYGGVLRRFEQWLQAEHELSLTDADAPQIKGIMLTEYYQRFYERELAVSTRNNYVSIIKEFFEFVHSAGVISENPSALLHCIKEKQAEVENEPQMYTPEQIEALLASISGRKPRCNDLRDTAIIALILGSGLRASEICNLNITHADEIRRGSVRCKRKGGSWKDVEVGEFVAPHVDRYLLTRHRALANEPLFISRQGNRLTRTTLWKSLAAKQKQADIVTGVHIFRHTVFSAVDHDGGSALARDVGDHNSLMVTNRYVHTTPEERLAAVNGTAYARILR